MNRFIKIVSAIILLQIATISLYAQKSETDYGLGLNINAPLIGLQSSDYSGRGMGGAHFFISAPLRNLYTTAPTSNFINNTYYHLAAGFGLIGIRDRQTDNHYTNSYIDGTASIYFKPFSESSDFKIIIGLRPYLLASSTTEKFRDGSYVVDNIDSANKNSSGDFGVSGIIGLSVALSSVASLELKYNHSFDNVHTSPTNIIGRQSTIEVTLSLSATGIRDKVYNKDVATYELIKKLHKGNLFVMLPTVNKSEIDALVNSGKTNQIGTLMDEIQQANLSIMKAFKNEFSFCNVIFFNDTNAYKVSNKVFGDIFFDDKYRTISTDSINTENYFVASFCEDVSNISRKISYGLFVYDDKIVQLERPFNSQQNQYSMFTGGDPINYLRKRLNYLTYDDYAKKIKKLNARLERFVN